MSKYGMRIRIGVLIFLFFSPLILKGDERGVPMEDLISIENLKTHLRNLHFDRNPYDHSAELEQAAQYILLEFSKTGLEAWEDILQWEGRSYKNIVAEKRGTTYPEKMIILGAHYDTVPGSPGADDNASAIAVLLEVARNIQKVPLEATVRLVAFSLEEYGFVGSAHYAREARRRGDRIAGMISLEMVGFTHPKQNYPLYVNPKSYPSVGDFVGIIGNERSKGLLEKVLRSFKTSVPRLPLEYLLVPGNGELMEEATLSDHSSFWDEGFPALMVTDTAFLRNPNYHLSSDTMETLDFEFMRKVAIGTYDSIIDLAK
jgi:aminopeptidase YwaD